MAGSNEASELIQYELAHYSDNRSPALLAGTIVVTSLLIPVFALRCYAQSLIGHMKDLDTWLLLAGLIFSLGVDAATIAATVYGIGKHQIRVNREDPNPPYNTVRIFQTGYFTEIFQAVALMFIKLAILKFFSRVFTLRQPVFRWSVYALAAYTIATGIGVSVEFIVICSPISYYWNVAWALNGLVAPFPVEGSCLPSPVRLAAPLLLDLFSDVAMLFLPVLGLWNLRMSRRKKVGLLFAFSLGAFVCVTNIIRIYFSFNINSAGDVSYVNADSFIWTAVQCSMGVLAASVPALAPLYRRFPSHGSKNSSNPRKSRGIWSTFRNTRTQGPSETYQDQESVRNLRNHASAPTVERRSWEEISMNHIPVLRET